MGWSLGWDDNWRRDIGYGVPAYCDHPGCDKKIHRGLSYVCGDDIYGGDHGCGLHFCGNHLVYHQYRDGSCVQVCRRCDTYKKPYTPKPDHHEWIEHKLTDPSWRHWRKENAKQVEQMKILVNPYE